MGGLFCTFFFEGHGQRLVPLGMVFTHGQPPWAVKPPPFPARARARWRPRLTPAMISSKGGRLPLQGPGYATNGAKGTSPAGADARKNCGEGGAAARQTEHRRVQRYDQSPVMRQPSPYFLSGGFQGILLDASHVEEKVASGFSVGP
jgi:hypothetical protein